MLSNVISNTKELTPSMKKYKSRYEEKSKLNPKSYSPSIASGIERHHIAEFDDGWIQFNGNENQLIIYSIYAENDYKDKFEYIYELAKCTDKKEVLFETRRNPKAWIRMIDNLMKKLKNKSTTSIKSYTMSVKIK
tara:strand:+ start:1213 stop:1617 length:405 start_codon:yes stop_codon:yes gene_type:complete